ncbi:MAG TPA: hypothetical protein VGO57_00655 [Verrucomicrobiae bacterium]|jgi:DNA-directed RNA polymerase subunit RPC12/RpoP
MSEFKYACPVCGQHMKCDSSQAGSVTDCPTCFQKIVIPQAPADANQKFILTGTQLSDRPPLPRPEINPYVVKPMPGFSGAVVVMIIFIFIGLAVAFVYRGTIFKSSHSPTATNQITAASPRPVVATASDTNWLLNLSGADIPAALPMGRIHGQDFAAERAAFSNGSLFFRDNTRGPLKFGISINFNGALAESLAGKTINVMTNADAAARVTLHWQADTESGKESFNNGYAMRLEFGALTNNHLLGKIYLCLPDASKSYLAGTFNAESHKPKPKK